MIVVYHLMVNDSHVYCASCVISVIALFTALLPYRLLVHIHAGSIAIIIIVTGVGEQSYHRNRYTIARWRCSSFTKTRYICRT